MKTNKIKASLLLLICSIVLSGTVGCSEKKYDVTSIPLPADYRIISGGRELFVVTEDGSLYWLDGDEKWDELSLDMKDAKDIKSAYDFDTIMVLRNNGTVYTVDPFSDNPEIHEISLPEPVSSIEMGSDSFAAITEEGSLYLWGDNSSGELGNGTVTPIETPYYVESLSNVSKVICDSGYTMVLTDEGALYISGYTGLPNDDNSTGLSYSTQFKQIKDLPPIADMAYAPHSFFASDMDENLYAWGTAYSYGHQLPEIYESDVGIVSIESAETAKVALAFLDDSGSVYFVGTYTHGKCAEMYGVTERVTEVNHVDEIIAWTSTLYVRKGDNILIIEEAHPVNS